MHVQPITPPLNVTASDPCDAPGLGPRSDGFRGIQVCRCVFFFQAEDGIRDLIVTGVQTCALPISNGKTFVSPVVAKIASEHGIDPSQVQGTGRGGRVTKKDMLNFIESGAQAAPAAPADRKSVV